MNAKEYLEQITAIQRLLYNLDCRIECKKEGLYRIGSPAFEPCYGSSTSDESRHSRKIMEIDELECDREKLHELLCQLFLEVKQRLETLDGISCALLTYRFLEQKSIRQIASKMSISKSSVERWIKAIVDNLVIPEGAFHLENELNQANLEKYLSWL